MSTTKKITAVLPGDHVGQEVGEAIKVFESYSSLREASEFEFDNQLIEWCCY